MAGFKGYKRSIVLDFNYDEVKKGVPDVNKQMALLNAEFRKSSEEIKETGSNLDKLGLQHQKLSNQLKIQGDKVKILKEELSALNEAEGNNEKAIARKTIELKNAETQYIKVQNELKSTTKELDKQAGMLGMTGEQWQKLSDKTKQIGTTMTTNITLPIVAAGGAAFKLASDMEETMNKVDVAFKRNAEEVKAWANDSLESMGLAKQSALDMAAGFASMADGMGISEAKTLKMSKSLTQLSADLASYFNTSTEMANTALTSVFTGETEALKKYGIVMTEANLQQYAYTKGIKEKVSEMTQAEKVMLRYNFVMDQTKNAQGDFARTSGGAAGQMRMFGEALKELGASFGEFIVPMVTPMIEFLNNLIVGFSSLSDSTKKAITNIAMVAAVAGPLLMVISSVAATINNISGAFKALSGVGALFNNTVGNATFATFAKWAGIITLVTVAITGLVMAINYLVGRGKEMNSAISDITGSISSAQNKLQNSMQSAHQAVNTVARKSYAIGTQYHQGGRALVGEYGPEEVILPVGSKVLTASETARNNVKSGNTIYNLSNFTIQTNNANDLFEQIQILARKGVLA